MQYYRCLARKSHESEGLFKYIFEERLAFTLDGWDFALIERFAESLVLADAFGFLGRVDCCAELAWFLPESYFIGDGNTFMG